MAEDVEPPIDDPPETPTIHYCLGTPTPFGGGGGDDDESDDEDDEGEGDDEA